MRVRNPFWLTRRWIAGAFLLVLAMAIPGMSEERKKPTAGFWFTVALVALLVGYPLSQGPAFCFCSQFKREMPNHRRALGAYRTVYVPLYYVKEFFPPFGDCQRAYLTRWNPKFWDASD